MSTDEEDGFFADGLSEELLNALAQVDDLKVASRTSAFVYRNSETDIREIGRALNVAHVLEGSVRRAGDRLRITAQLIKVEDGFHLWSETYDRQSSDVIEIQEDIARRVSLALQSALVTDPGMLLMDVGTSNGAAYRLYLEGRALLERRGLGVARAISKFEEAIALDPDYAQAYAGLASGHSLSSNYLRTPTAIAHQRARSNAQKAIELNGRLAEPHAVLAVLELEQNHWREAITLFEQAEALDPSDVVTLQWSGEALLYLGYIEAAKEKLQRALEVEPESAILNLVFGNIQHVEPDLDQAEHYFRLAERHGMAHAVLNTGLVELQRGEAGTAARDFARNMEALQFLATEDVDDMAYFIQSIVEGTLTVDGNIERFPALAADEDFRAIMYLYAGDAVNTLKLIELDEDRDKDTYYKIWSDVIPGIRQLPEFRTFVDNTGMLDYWREFGWPDKCRPAGDTDFECQ
jgi:TolB-like protein/Tfp pilus assembly protein PilF